MHAGRNHGDKDGSTDRMLVHKVFTAPEILVEVYTMVECPVMLQNIIKKLRKRFNLLALADEFKTFTQLEDVDGLQLFKFQIFAGKRRQRLCRLKNVDSDQTKVTGTDDPGLGQC